MSNVTVTTENGTEISFEDTIGHQIGNGAVQIMMGDGTQRVFNNFKEVFIDLDAEEKAVFAENVAKAKARAEAEQAMAEQIEADYKAEVEANAETPPAGEEDNVAPTAH